MGTITTPVMAKAVAQQRRDTSVTPGSALLVGIMTPCLIHEEHPLPPAGRGVGYHFGFRQARVAARKPMER
jgi:hypothetical protein